MKKYICLFLVISLVLACSGSVFAAPELASGSAFAYKPLSQAGLLAESSIKAVGGQQVYISESGNRYRFNGSSVSGGSLLNLSFGEFFSEIMASIAYSAKGITDRASSYYYDLTSSDGGVSVNSSVGSGSWLSSVVRQIYEFEKDFYRFQYKVFNDGIVTSLSFWSDLFPSSGSNFWTGSFTNNYNMNHLELLRVGGTSGTSFTSSINDVPYFMGLKYLISEFNNNMTYMAVRLTNHVHGSYPLYSMVDMTPSDIPDSLGNGSLWDTALRGFSNLSYGLSRLSYVLANDEDIEARDASSSVRQAYTNDFLKPSGSASASASDFGTLASGSSSVSDSFHSSYGASDALGALSDQSDGRWDWFSQITMDNLNSSGNRSSSMLKSNRGYTNFYEERYREIKHD